jgi:DNA-binding NarL/FixJ family response regulator
VTPVSVLLAVSDRLRRALLLRALERREDLRVVGTEQDGCQALSAILADAPDVAVVDTGLPTLDGMALCRRLADRPELGTRVLLVDGDPPVTRERAIASGAAGCVAGTTSTMELCDAIASIANGGTIFHE